MPDSNAKSRPATARTWLNALLPLVALLALLLLFFRFGPAGVFRGAFPPVEELTITRVTLPDRGVLRVHVVNGGPAPVTVAQVLVDDASWVHTVDGPRTIGRLASREITIPYPWVEGEPVVVRLVTSTGLTIDSEVPVAVRTPAPDARYLTTFALLGLYAGVIPVFIGLLWFPFLRELSRKWIEFLLSLTAGLLLFLGVDALAEAVELSAAVPRAFQGLGLVLLGLIGTPLLLAVLGRARHGTAKTSPIYVATLVALGIGLHNMGEGLAIGASYATGEIALGSFLVIGFLLHNTTEGLAILAPLATERVKLRTLLLLGLLAGVPTIVGAWIGGFTYSPGWTALFFAIGAGAIAQVLVVLAGLFRSDDKRGFTSPLNVAGFLAGMMIMYLTGLLVPA
ncbi:MAG: ZIP family metal transporter [Gemmatimonadaceae bacterium]